jgi:hypothetical protein
LGKQRVEAFQIVNTLTGKSSGWANHPAVKMWHGYEFCLMLYANVMIEEWKRRGYRNNMKLYDVPLVLELPTWIGDDRLYASHRSNLLRKDPIYYGNFGWTEGPELPYFWPER